MMGPWDRFLRRAEKHLGKQAVDRWLRPFRLLRFDARNLYLEAQSQFQIFWFQEHASKVPLNNSAQQPFKLHFFINNTPFSPHPIKHHVKLNKQSTDEQESGRATHFLSDHLDPHAQFNTFITQPDTPHLPMTILSETDPIPHNLIYLYGPKGRGKSHLLMAYAHAMIQKGQNPFYVQAETFIAHVIKAFRMGTLDQFRQVYRRVDALLLDDVHLLEKKKACQEEFFHTFNHLHERGIQLILSSLSPPALLKYKGVADRLISRFEWGLALPLPPAKQQQRQRYILQKSGALSLSLSQELQIFLVTTFPNFHHLAAAVNALAFRAPAGQHLELAVAKQLLADLIKHREQNELTVETIISRVADLRSLEIDLLLSRRQDKTCSLPRHVAIYLCRTELNLSYPKIGSIFDRDHSTIITATRKIERQIEARDEETLRLIRAVLTQTQPRQPARNHADLST